MKKWSVPLVIMDKYVGELKEDIAKESMFSEDFQRLDVLEWSADAQYLLEELMGIAVEPRTEYIFKNVDFSTITE